LFKLACLTATVYILGCSHQLLHADRWVKRSC